MENIIDKIDTQLIEKELTKESFLRNTNKGGNQIYVVDSESAPNIMLEIGRLRELAFRAAGGGTGKACDIDMFDTMTPPCRQLIVWNPVEREIIGGYRFILGENMHFDAPCVPRIATSHMFRFSQQFVEEYLPYTIELGRSFVTIDYQASRLGSKCIYALDNLWDGLGALTIVYPHIKYMFGKFTMYPNYPGCYRDMILYFLNLYFHDDKHLVQPIEPLETNPDISVLKSIFSGNDFKEDYKTLHTTIRNAGINIPPLVNAYMGLSPSMKFFGTAINREFGDVEESGILISIDDIFEEKKSRHIDTYEKQCIACSDKY